MITGTIEIESTALELESEWSSVFWSNGIGVVVGVQHGLVSIWDVGGAAKGDPKFIHGVVKDGFRDDAWSKNAVASPLPIYIKTKKGKEDVILKVCEEGDTKLITLAEYYRAKASFGDPLYEKFANLLEIEPRYVTLLDLVRELNGTFTIDGFAKHFKYDVMGRYECEYVFGTLAGVTLWADSDYKDELRLPIFDLYVDDGELHSKKFWVASQPNGDGTIRAFEKWDLPAIGDIHIVVQWRTDLSSDTKVWGTCDITHEENKIDCYASSCKIS